MQCTKKQLGLQLVVFSLVLALAGGCKTVGSRALDDQEEKPSRVKRAAVIAVAVLGVAAGVFGGVALAKRLRGQALAKQSDAFNKQFDEYLDDFKRLTKKVQENPDDKQALKEVMDAGERIDAMVKEAGSDELARRSAMISLEVLADVEADTLLKNLQEANTPAARQKAKEEIEEAIEGVNEGLAQMRAGDYSGLDIDSLAKEVVGRNLPDPREAYDKFEDYVAAHKNATGAKPEAELRELWDNYDSIFATRVEEVRKDAANDLIEMLERSLNKLRQAVQ